MKVVSTYEFRDNLAALLDEVAKNESPIVISKFGKSFVKVVPITASDKTDWRKFYGFLGKSGETGDKLVNRVRRSNIEKVTVKKLLSR